MKRLFVVRNKRTRRAYDSGKAKEPVYYSDKMLAKAARDELNGPDGPVVWEVKIGPDHWRAQP